MGLVGRKRRKPWPFGTHPRARQSAPGIEPGCATAAGRRAVNEDRCETSAYWAAVSDGAGGHAGGDIAAEQAIEHVRSCLGRSAGPFDDDVVIEAFTGANSAIRARQRTDASVADMAATLSLAACTSTQPGGSRWVVGNVGDSPVWHYSGHRLDRISQEHNVASELVRSGVVSPQAWRGHPGRSLITRALGIAEEVAPHITSVILRPGDLLILASDGLEVLTEAEISSLLATPAKAPSNARRLVDAALAASATDNVTVVVLRYLDTAAAQYGLVHQPQAGRTRQ